MKSTREVSHELGISAAALRAHIAAGHVHPPNKRVGLSFLWTDAEINAARAELARPGRRRRRNWFHEATIELAENEQDD